MQAADLTLTAALRDATAARPDARHRALRNLAPALLEQLEEAGPAWQAAERHPLGSDVVTALESAIQTDTPPMAGTAAIGLGWLGSPSVRRLVDAWITDPKDDEDASFLRECGLIALGHLGVASRDHNPELTDAIASQLITRLQHPHPEVRFQAGLSLAELHPQPRVDIERALVDAVVAERHEDVQLGLIEALSRIHNPAPHAREAMRRLVQEDDTPTKIGFEAAMLLASARDPAAGERLSQALDHGLHRNRALEGLAYLGERAPADVVPTLRRLATRPWVVGLTRVRAAYAWMCISSDPAARACLERLAWHPRAAVREGVRDAWSALAERDDRD